MDVVELVANKTRALPSEQQRQVLAFVERLERQATPSASLEDPYGSCSDLRTDLPFEEFAENRKAMWGQASEKELE